MAKIRKIYDQTIKPDGSKVTIYPITSTRAVYTPESITMEALINEGYRFGGVIEHLEDSPEFTDQRVFYLADKVGVYPNFGNLTLAGGELGVFCYNKSQWIKGILKGGGTNLTGYQVVTSASLLPDEESTIGYIIGTNLYVWVGEGGDTKEGKYKNVGPFVGPQGNGIDQVFLSPTNYKLTIDFTDGTSWTSEQSIRGITGAKGDKGDPGLTGAAGATGPKGDKGDKGDSGVSLGEVTLTTNLDETETGKALDASAMQTIPHWVDEEQEIEDVPSNYYTKTQTDQKLLNHKAEVNQYLTNQDNDIARLEDRIDNMVDGVDEFIHHRPTVINNGTIINAPDDEDLVATEENTLKFADRPAINAMGYVILRKNKTFAEQFTKTNTIYEIRYDFDLGGESVTIPAGCILKFEGGSVTNGTIVGNETRIEAPDSVIFPSISISGTWDVPTIFVNWFGPSDTVGADNTDIINGAFALSSDDCYNEIIFPGADLYISERTTFNPEHLYIFDVKSNTKIQLNGSLILNPTDKTHYYIFYLNEKKNVEICGGAIIGDVVSHTGSTGEYGMGILLYGAENVYIHDITINNCWGDGICIQSSWDQSHEHPASHEDISKHSKNVRIIGVNFDSNRRQGISIEGAYGVEISNCQILNTGAIKGTSPMRGIDIEPFKINEAVWNVDIKNNIFGGNAGGAIAIWGNGGDNTGCAYNTTIESNRTLDPEEVLPISMFGVDGCYITNSNIFLGDCGLFKNVTVKDCLVKKVRVVQGTASDNKNISFSNCEFVTPNSEGSLYFAGVQFAVQASFNHCSFDLDTSLPVFSFSNGTKIDMTDCNITKSGVCQIYGCYKMQNCTVKATKCMFSISQNDDDYLIKDNTFVCSTGSDALNLTTISENPSCAKTFQLINNNVVADGSEYFLSFTNNYREYLKIRVEENKTTGKGRFAKIATDHPNTVLINNAVVGNVDPLPHIGELKYTNNNHPEIWNGNRWILLDGGTSTKYVVLTGDKSFASQITETNTVYEIRDEFDLNGTTVTIRTGCRLIFNGGKLTNGSVVFTNLADKFIYASWMDNITLLASIRYMSYKTLVVDRTLELDSPISNRGLDSLMYFSIIGDKENDQKFTDSMQDSYSRIICNNCCAIDIHGWNFAVKDIVFSFSSNTNDNPFIKYDTQGTGVSDLDSAITNCTFNVGDSHTSNAIISRGRGLTVSGCLFVGWIDDAFVKIYMKHDSWRENPTVDVTDEYGGRAFWIHHNRVHSAVSRFVGFTYNSSEPNCVFRGIRIEDNIADIGGALGYISAPSYDTIIARNTFLGGVYGSYSFLSLTDANEVKILDNIFRGYGTSDMPSYLSHAYSISFAVRANNKVKNVSVCNNISSVRDYFLYTEADLDGITVLGNIFTEDAFTVSNTAILRALATSTNVIIKDNINQSTTNNAVPALRAWDSEIAGKNLDNITIADNKGAKNWVTSFGQYDSLLNNRTFTNINIKYDSSESPDTVMDVCSVKVNVKSKIGFNYFNATLGKPVWWKGSAWVDGAGNTIS